MRDLVSAAPTRLQQALLVASLAEGRSQLAGARLDEDTRLLVGNLLALGVAIIVDETADRIDIAGTAGYWPNSNADLSCAGSFSLACLLTAACCVGRGQYTVHCPAIEHDPGALSVLLDALRDLGAAIGLEEAGADLAINVGAANLRGGHVSFPPDCPPAVLDSVLLVSPYATNDVFVTCAATAELGTTLQVMDMARASVVQEAGRLIIPAPQCYRGFEVSA